MSANSSALATVFLSIEARCPGFFLFLCTLASIEGRRFIGWANQNSPFAL